MSSAVASADLTASRPNAGPPDDGAARSRTQPVTRSRSGPGLWWQGLICGGVVALATPTAVLLAILLIPVGAALILESRTSRHMVRPILIAGAAASIGPLVTLWGRGHHLDDSLAIAGDVSVLATAWAGQAGAWLLAELAPVLIRLALDTKSMARRAMLLAARSRLEAEWGFSAVTDVSATTIAQE